jgi:4'-phosphopantetheinyl transferase
MATDVFAPKELSDLAALSEDEKMLRAVHLWTLKESYIKARGMGLALPLDGFAFRFCGDRISLEVEPELNDGGAHWQFQTQMLGPHCISMAIASSAGQRQVEILQRVM